MRGNWKQGKALSTVEKTVAQSRTLGPGDLPNPGIEPRFLALQADSLLSEPPGKSKNTGVGSLFLLQGIFPTQESNWGLLHCRQILYKLSYQGNPHIFSPRNSPGQNTGLGCRALLQGIFPTQGSSNPGLPHCKWILYHLRHPRSKLKSLI